MWAPFFSIAFLFFAMDATASTEKIATPAGGISVETIDDNTNRSHIRRNITIYSRIADGKWRKTRACYPLKGQDVALKVKRTRDATIRWYMIFADLTRNYNNAHPPWEENAYQWIGFDRIVYHRIGLSQFRNSWQIHPFADDGSLWQGVRAWFRANGKDGYVLDYYSDTAGTFWFQAEVDAGGKTSRSFGIEDSTDRGLSPHVLRVSIRDGEGYLGYLMSFFNVPGLFGSVLYQSKNHIGADCADVLMAARSKWKNAPLGKNYNVSMLVSKFQTVAEFEMRDGVPDHPIKWNEEVRPGDFIAVRYGHKGKKYHHIGALYRDDDKNGRLDGEDVVLHAGPDPLHFSKLKHHAFDGHVAILRHR